MFTEPWEQVLLLFSLTFTELKFPNHERVVHPSDLS